MFKKVEEFENKIADFYGAPKAVATDCCTHAIELCLRHLQPDSITIPKHTYISIPFTAKKLNLPWAWSENNWEEYYYLENTPIVDAAVFWKRNGYIPGTYMCLSFQFRKHLSLGRGGAILCETDNDYNILKKMSYDGRRPDLPWSEQDIDTIGYHYYMTPETAEQGIIKLHLAQQKIPKRWTWHDYPDLTTKKVFQE